MKIFFNTALSSEHNHFDPGHVVWRDGNSRVMQEFVYIRKK